MKPIFAPGYIAQWKTAKYVGENYWQICRSSDHTAVIDNTGIKMEKSDL